jgi:DNA-binding CsgD family transcriptional regulator
MPPESTTDPLAYERQLVDRIAVREAAAQLTLRQRQVLHGYYRLDESRKEIAGRLNLSAPRIAQLHERGLKMLRARLTARPWPPPLPAPRPPPGFDKAAFLRHMIRLKEDKARRAAELFTEERDGLEAMLARERREREPPKPYEPTPWPKPLNYPITFTVVGPKPAPPGPAQLQEMAQYALRLFLLHHPVPILATATMAGLGPMTSAVDFALEGQLDEAVRRLAAHVPQDAWLSTQPLPVPLEGRSATAQNAFAAVRVVISTDERRAEIAVTWAEYLGSV